MTIVYTLSLSLLCFFSSSHASVDLAYIRSNYEKSVTDKKLCNSMIIELRHRRLTNVELAYLGGLEIIWASHTISPFSKINAFKTGKARIEKAIQNEGDNVEIRFVRLSIQKNCPKFLGYNRHIREDELYLKERIKSVKPESLKKMIINLSKK